MTIVRRITIDEAESDPDFQSLVDEYAAEAKIPEMPNHNPNIAGYKQMEALGMYHMFGAYDGDKFIGFISVLVTPVPHYSAKIATTESFFVSASHRKGGAGVRLLRAAEACAKEQGAVILFVSAPTGGRLVQVMPGIGYRESHRVFCRSML